MILYQVTITVHTSIEEKWLDWMRRVHIPEVLKTGCFTRSTIAKVTDPIGDGSIYVISYECASSEVYERYRQDFAPALQKAHTDKFAGQFRASRMVLEEVGTFTG